MKTHSIDVFLILLLLGFIVMIFISYAVDASRDHGAIYNANKEKFEYCVKQGVDKEFCYKSHLLGK